MIRANGLRPVMGAKPEAIEDKRALARISSGKDGMSGHPGTFSRARANTVDGAAYSANRRGRPSHQGTGTGLSMRPEARTIGRWARRWKRTLTS
jgi:hypothetical protein